MKRIKSEKEQYRQKRAVQFVRRVQALVLTVAVLVVGGLTANAASVGDIIDTQYYADKYPDLKAAFGYDTQALIQHYLTYGIAEGRDAGGLLDVREYREKYADLDEAFGDNWDAYVDHFLTYGAFEGRDSGTAFNALDYAERYSDLKEAFGNNILQLFQHYQTYGKTENRESRSETVVQEEKRAIEEARREAARQEAWENLYPVLTDANGNVPDLGGMEIIIRDWWSSGEREANPNAYQQAVYDYQDWAMERYNFTIKQVKMDEWDSYPQPLVDYIDNGGDDANYVFILVNSAELMAVEREGYAYDLSTLDCLKFSEEKWVSGVHAYHTIGDSIYAMNFNLPEPRQAMYFNKSILREAGIDPDDIYKWQESGEWTWDKFEELCEKITRDTDGDGENDVWALNGVSVNFYTSAVYSNDADFIGKEDGKYVNGVASKKTQEALNWALFVWDEHAAPVPEDAAWDYPYTSWPAGVGAFLPNEVYYAGEGMDYSAFDKKDLGMVCFPMGPAASDYTNVYNDNAYVIPSCYDAEKAWNIAFALNAWTQPIPGYDAKEAVLNSYYPAFADTEPVELTIKRLLTNGRVTYHDQVLESTALGEDLTWDLWDAYEDNYAYVIEKWNDIIAAANSGN